MSSTSAITNGRTPAAATNLSKPSLVLFSKLGNTNGTLSKSLGNFNRLDFHAEGGVIELPYSHAALLSATERHDYRTGCQNIENCHGSVVRHPIAVESLAPDIEAPWTIEAYRAGRDPAMEAVTAALR